ncbi:MAG: hypothetical protein J0653_02225 [Deltaproteobacteria bacterium]|nr:hypothetical protein [Deltaproteobacteria bacterium]
MIAAIVSSGVVADFAGAAGAEAAGATGLSVAFLSPPPQPLSSNSVAINRMTEAKWGFVFINKQLLHLYTFVVL